jgi:dolichyl-phosphate-mannose--protein O-mannosyl transferase
MRAFPLLLLVLLLYNLAAFGCAAAGYHDMPAFLARGAQIAMASSDKWTVTLGDGFILLGFVLLFAEMLRAVAAIRSIPGHVLTALVFVAAVAELLFLKGFATSPFFFITVMALFDTVAGITISVILVRHEHRLAEPDPEEHHPDQP